MKRIRAEEFTVARVSVRSSEIPVLRQNLCPQSLAGDYRSRSPVGVDDKDDPDRYQTVLFSKAADIAYTIANYGDGNAFWATVMEDLV
jgi:hypothetical protein